MAKGIENQVSDLIASSLAAAGYDLVRVHVAGSGKYAALQIMAERLDGAGVTVEDCAAISHIVTEKFAVEADLADKYDLEVSSPGIDRPLVRIKEYERFQGFVAQIGLAGPVGGKKKFQGKIAAVRGENIEFIVDKDSLSVPFAAIEKAKLVLTDDLLKAAARGKVNP